MMVSLWLCAAGLRTWVTDPVAWLPRGGFGAGVGFCLLSVSGLGPGLGSNLARGASSASSQLGAMQLEGRLLHHCRSSLVFRSSLGVYCLV